MNRAQIALVGCLLSSIACGDSSGGGRNTLFRGTLIQGAEATNRMAHELGGGLPGVEICTLGQCTLTEPNGSWRIRSGAGRDQEILFTVKGHGADTSFILDIPLRARTVEMDKDLHTEFGDHHDDHDEHDDHAGHDHDDDHDDHNDHDDHEGHDHDGHAHRIKAEEHDHSGHDHADDDHDHHEDMNLPRNEQLTVKRVIIDGMNYRDAHAFFENEGHDDHDHESHEEDHDEEHDHEDHDDHDDHEDEDHGGHDDHDHGHSH